MPASETTIPRLTTIALAAELLTCDHKTVRRLVSRGEIRAWHIRGAKMLRVSLDDVEKLLDLVPTVAGGHRAS